MKGSGFDTYEAIIRQITLLQKVSVIWPDIFQYLVFDSNNYLIGFSMKYFQGKKIWQAYTDPSNIYYKNPSSRVRLVKKVKQVVRRLQQIKVCHGDMHIDNIMIKQQDPAQQDCEILIIDYGLAFIIEDYQLQKPGLTGWQFMKPHQAKTGNYFYAGGLNAYMFGRVALQILLLQDYNDYSHNRLQSAQQQYQQLAQFGFDPSVKKQIQQYLDHNSQIRNKALFEQSRMKEEVSNSHIVFDLAMRRKYGSLTDKIMQKLSRSIIGNRYDQSYYQLHPQKLGYK